MSTSYTFKGFCAFAAGCPLQFRPRQVHSGGLVVAPRSGGSKRVARPPTVMKTIKRQLSFGSKSKRDAEKRAAAPAPAGLNNDLGTPRGMPVAQQQQPQLGMPMAVPMTQQQQDPNAGAYMPLPVAVAAPLLGSIHAPSQEQSPRSAPSANMAALNAARAMAAQRNEGGAESPRRQSGHSEASPRRQAGSSGGGPAPSAGGNAAALAAARSLAAKRDSGPATPRSDALVAARALGAARAGRNSPDGGGGGGGSGSGSSGPRRDLGFNPPRRADRPRSPPRGEASTPRGAGGPVDALAAARALAAQRGGGSTPRASEARSEARSERAHRSGGAAEAGSSRDAGRRNGEQKERRGSKELWRGLGDEGRRGAAPGLGDPAKRLQVRRRVAGHVAGQTPQLPHDFLEGRNGWMAFVQTALMPNCSARDPTLTLTPTPTPTQP